MVFVFDEEEQQQHKRYDDHDAKQTHQNSYHYGDTRGIWQVNLYD